MCPMCGQRGIDGGQRVTTGGMTALVVKVFGRTRRLTFNISKKGAMIMTT